MSEQPRSWTRRALRWLVWFALAVTTYYAICVVQVWWTGRASDGQRVDAIVVLGAAQYDGRPSPQFAGRLDHALARFEAGDAEVIVVTGGKLPADRFTEAEAAERYLIARGVPQSAILRESTGRTTFESLRNARVVAVSAGVDRVLLVTDPYHALRSRLIADEVGFDSEVSSTDLSSGLGRTLAEAGGVAVGRIIGFGRLSGITK